jgi:hypothetical protein
MKKKTSNASGTEKAKKLKLVREIVNSQLTEIVGGCPPCSHARMMQN